MLLVPRAIGLGATQIVFVVLTSLATTLGDEALPVFNFAFAMLQIPIGVIGVPLGVVLLPSLARQAATGVTEGFTRLLVRGLAILVFVMIGIAALGIVVSEDVVRILFGIAGISETAIEATGVALAVFLVGLTAHSVIAVLARAFYALKDTLTPVLAALGTVVANIVLANLLVAPLGLNGLAAAIAISAWLETVALVVLLRGLDMTRRDLQAEAKRLQRPWEIGKPFEGSAPVGTLSRIADVGPIDSGAVTLDVNGDRRQTGDLKDMIWNADEIVAHLSRYFELRPGDLIFTGTPAGVGPVAIGDRIVAKIDRLEPLTVDVVARAPGR